MRKTLIVVCALALFAAPAWAQDDGGTTIRVTGFAAPGMFVAGGIVAGATPLRIGGMIEQVGSSGFGFAFDASYLTTFEDVSENSIAMLAPAVLYEFHTDGPLKPYVRGGPTFILGGGDAAFLVHYGGGINYWVKENIGLKVEGRHSLFVEAPELGIIDVLVGAVFKF